MYPRVVVDLKGLQANVKAVLALCAQYGIEPTGVTKAFRGDPRLAQAYLAGGLKRLGDSRLSNLQRLAGLEAEKWLLRPPMLSEIDAVVRWADVSLHSELAVLRRLQEEAQRQRRRHRVILMADLGDIREGYVDYDELLSVARLVEEMEWVDLYGVGTNLTCFSFVQPDTAKLAQLVGLRDRVAEAVGRPLELISGGNSATLDLMLRGGIPKGVNNLRLGESLLFGRERAKYRYLPGTRNDLFMLECQIIEVKDKPSLPWGTIGVDSYGRSPVLVDRGPRRKKAICALGKQDFDLETTWPEDPGVIMLGTSSDHLMLDVTDSAADYQVGDVIRLRLGYFSTLRAFTSADVARCYEA